MILSAWLLNQPCSGEGGHSAVQRQKWRIQPDDFKTANGNELWAISTRHLLLCYVPGALQSQPTCPHPQTQGEKTLSVETKIALDCPYCHESIYETLSWFKQTYSTCPACDQGLAARQFATLIAELEQAMDANIEEMLNGKPHTSCCGKKSSCC